jgi:hypothetical protein
MLSGEGFRADFEVPGGSFCFLRWRLPLRSRLQPIVPSGAASVLGPVVSLVVAVAGGSCSGCVDPFGTVAVIGCEGSGVDKLEPKRHWSVPAQWGLRRRYQECAYFSTHSDRPTSNDSAV